MSESTMLRMTLQSRRLVRDQRGYNVWQVDRALAELPADQTALLLCDVWDRHSYRGPAERLAAMVERMNELVRALRGRGVLIVHAPSETMAFYANTEARLRAMNAPAIDPPAMVAHPEPPLPVDASEAAGETTDNFSDDPGVVWTRQHPGIEIDQGQDAISEHGRELMDLYHQRGVRNLLIMGVHTNICVLNRSFAIKHMVKRGYNVVLVRDLTDAIYNPARPPYVSHEQGTSLVVEYIEKFWCASTTSEELLGGASHAATNGGDRPC